MTTYGLHPADQTVSKIRASLGVVLLVPGNSRHFEEARLSFVHESDRRRSTNCQSYCASRLSRLPRPSPSLSRSLGKVLADERYRDKYEHREVRI